MSKRRTRRRTQQAGSAPRPVERPAPSPALWHSRMAFVPAALVLLGSALALYWSSLRYPLVFDDLPILRDYALNTFYADAVSHFGLRWISDSTFWLIHRLGGRDLLWHRLANVLLHAGTAVLVFGFFSRLFRVVVDEPQSNWLALSGALLFVLHPAAVYGVAYLIQRSIILAAFFSLAALWCVLEGLIRRSGGWYIAAAAGYSLAVCSKEHAVMVPAVAAALAVLVRGPSFELTRRLVGVFALFAAVGVTVILKSRGVIGAAYEPFAGDAFGHLGAPRGEFDAGLAYPLSVLNQATLFFRYLLTWLVPWPGWMSVDVRTAFPREFLGWPHTAGFLAWLMYAVVATWLLLKRGRAGLLGFGLLCPWLLALTEVATVRVQEPFVLYRSYLWMIGVPAIMPALAGRLSSRWRIGIAAVACLILVIAARERLDSFASPLRLWDDVVSKNADLQAPYVERAYIARGYIHFDGGQLDAAGADFDRALDLNSRSPDALVARGSLRLQRGQLREALEDTDRAVAIDPGYASAYDKRCAVKMGLNRFRDAAADCDKAVALEPKNQDAWINRGVLYHRGLGQLTEAATSYRQALALDPGNGVANFNYGMLLIESGRRDESARRHIAIGCEAGIASACKILRYSSQAP